MRVFDIFAVPGWWGAFWGSQTGMFHLWHHHSCAERRGSCALHKALPKKKKKYIYKYKIYPISSLQSSEGMHILHCSLDLTCPEKAGSWGNRWSHVLSCPPFTEAAMLQGPGLVWRFSIFPQGLSASLGGDRGNRDMGSVHGVALAGRWHSGHLSLFLANF